MFHLLRRLLSCSPPLKDDPTAPWQRRLTAPYKPSLNAIDSLRTSHGADCACRICVRLKSKPPSLQIQSSPEQRFLLEARLEGAKASGAKYKKALAQHVDGRLRFTMQFSGAGATGRTAHKGFQPGNMPRSKARAESIDELTLPFIRSGEEGEACVVGGPNTACGDALRHTIIAPPGGELIVADFSNIESRVLAWIAGEQWKLDAYCAADRGEGADLYRLLYSRFFGATLDTSQTSNVSQERLRSLLVDLAEALGLSSQCPSGTELTLTLSCPFYYPLPRIK